VRRPARPVTVDLPVVFVSDDAQPQTETMTAFDPLTQDDIADQLAARFKSLGGGVVDVPGIPVDLLRGATPGSIDVQLVRRLNITGQLDGRDILPRLGPPPDRPAADYAADFAVEVELVEMRTLLPAHTDAHTAALCYTADFLTGGDAASIRSSRPAPVWPPTSAARPAGPAA